MHCDGHVVANVIKTATTKRLTLTNKNTMFKIEAVVGVSPSKNDNGSIRD
jgi:hypothetical protein